LPLWALIENTGILRLICVILLCLVSFSFITRKPDVLPSFSHKVVEKSMVRMPAGTMLNCDSAGGDIFYVAKPQKVVESFHICKHELSNGEYLQFINDIYKRDTLFYHRMLPDTQVWKKGLSFNEPFTLYYFRHPAYRDFPVVGITHEQARRYCEWLTGNYMSSPKRKYKSVKFSLPTRDQWLYAAGGSKQTFPFGYYIQNSKGQALANFRVFLQGSISRARETAIPGADTSKKVVSYIADPSLNYYIHIPEDFGSFITTPVESYYPGINGLYNMGGNVEEYVRENGITKGGSWNDPGYYLRNCVEETYDTTLSASAERGFRYVMEILK
jgi:sulfatase modifying factor 1